MDVMVAAPGWSPLVMLTLVWECLAATAAAAARESCVWYAAAAMADAELTDAWTGFMPLCP